jgi:hypothetical protein
MSMAGADSLRAVIYRFDTFEAQLDAPRARADGRAAGAVEATALDASGTIGDMALHSLFSRKLEKGEGP